MVYDQLSKDPNSLSNLDQDLPNYAQHSVPIFSLPMVRAMLFLCLEISRLMLFCLHDTVYLSCTVKLPSGIATLPLFLIVQVPSVKLRGVCNLLKLSCYT